MVKILQLVGKMTRAGQETFIMNIYRNIDHEKFQFGFLSMYKGEGEYDEEIRSYGGKFHYIDLFENGGKMRHIKNFFIMRKAFKKLSLYYDIVHINNYHAFDTLMASLAALGTGYKKVITHSHSSSADGHFILHKIAKTPLSLLPVIRLACSNKAGEWLYSRKDFIVIENGIDLKRFNYKSQIRSHYRQKLNLSDKFVIGHVGRFFPVKNHIFMVDMFYEYLHHNSNAVLMFVGDGPEEEKIKNRCECLGISEKVIFMGSRDDVAELYQVMDVFVFPSIYEGVPLSVVEASTSGLHCLLSDKVPNTVDITPLVLHLSISNGVTKWVDKLIEISLYIKEHDRAGMMELVKKAGFDISYASEKLEDIYLS